MDDTDKIDVIQHFVSCAKKSYVWHKKIAIYHIQRIAVVNAFVLGKQYFPDFMKNKTFANFSLSVIERLMYIMRMILRIHALK